MAKTTFNPGVQKTKTQLYKENAKRGVISDIDKLIPRYNVSPKYSLNKDHSLPESIK